MKRKGVAMKSRNTICILLLSLGLIAASAWAEESVTISASVPTKNLPEGFKLLAIQTASTKGVNMTDEIKDFYGAEDIGPVNATIGIYVWAPLGQGYDSKITLLTLKDEEHAKAAVSNYMSLPEYQKPPYKGIDRFASAVINGHNATEIRKEAMMDSLKYLYLWSNNNTVVLVEGNGDIGKSRDLASATGI
jgi:hypothetical protein